MAGTKFVWTTLLKESMTALPRTSTIPYHVLLLCNSYIFAFLHTSLGLQVRTEDKSENMLERSILQPGCAPFVYYHGKQRTCRNIAVAFEAWPP